VLPWWVAVPRPQEGPTEMEQARMGRPERADRIARTPLGGMIVTLGTLTMIVGSVWVGIVVELI
jgi:hypothetical protein